MKKILLITLLLILPYTLFSISLQQEFALGYYEDLGVTLGLRIEDDKSDFPLYIQSRIGTTYQFEPGNAEDARRVFINDNQGGNIQEYGQSFLVSLDLGWKFYTGKSISLELLASGLLNHYKAHYSFIGNNEAFVVKTTALGVGIGTVLRVPFSNNRSSFIVKGGVEYFPKTRIDSHGTFYYTPDGSDENPRQDYSYSDADDAINQPYFRPYFMVGLLFPIG